MLVSVTLPTLNLLGWPGTAGNRTKHTQIRPWLTAVLILGFALFIKIIYYMYNSVSLSHSNAMNIFLIMYSSLLLVIVLERLQFRPRF